MKNLYTKHMFCVIYFFVAAAVVVVFEIKTQTLIFRIKGLKREGSGAMNRTKSKRNLKQN